MGNHDDKTPDPNYRPIARRTVSGGCLFVVAIIVIVGIVIVGLFAK